MVIEMQAKRKLKNRSFFCFFTCIIPEIRIICNRNYKKHLLIYGKLFWRVLLEKGEKALEYVLFSKTPVLFLNEFFVWFLLGGFNGEVVWVKYGVKYEKCVNFP